MPNQPYYNNDPQYPNQQQGSYPPYQDYDSTTEQNINQGNAYMQRQQQTYQDPAGNQVQKRKEVYRDFNQSMINTRYWITSVIYFLLGVLEVVLGLRFLFRLFGASEASSFIRFLYDLSHPFVTIFNGIFNDQTIGSAGVFEISTILAMLIYALIAWGIVSLVRVIFFSNVPSRREYVTTRRQRRS
ncbi:YggT family protein [Dictyobacter kobayashii]|uniref:YggT family protein n=1 Tax=Dictyobacter kobayashii TaxID=2014872 RepID=A0A402AZ01_9CHLR|nr:YggT family protein [Dictyobacter kobayashii]GCE24334.1 hypothetical protein KDK_81340 [Dictyobacter kobayashii]